MQETQETWVWFLGWEEPLEKGMVTHFNILAGRIPWTEKPGGLLSIGLQRVRHNWVTVHTHTNWKNEDLANCVYGVLANTANEQMWAYKHFKQLEGYNKSSKRRPLGKRNGNPLQYSCLENPMDITWWAVVHRVAKSQIQLKQLSMHASENLKQKLQKI